MHERKKGQRTGSEESLEEKNKAIIQCGFFGEKNKSNNVCGQIQTETNLSFHLCE